MALKTTLIVLLGVLNLFLFSRTIWGPTGIMEYRHLKTQLQTLRADIASLDADNRALSRDIRLMQSDNQYVEKVVRQKLHYMRDNEIVYIFAESAPNQSEATASERKN